MKYSCQKTELEPESDQASSSNCVLQETEDRNKMIPWGMQSAKSWVWGSPWDTKLVFFLNK